MKTIRCKGEITDVVVHARGAIVTRRVELSGQDSGEIIYEVEGIAAGIESGSVRVWVDQRAARLVSVRTRTKWPESTSREGPLLERVEELNDSLQDKQAELRELQERLQCWEGLRIAPKGRKALEQEGPRQRTKTTLELIAIAGEQRRKLSRRQVELGEEIEKLTEELESARLTAAQASEKSRRGESTPEIVFVVHLTEVEGLKEMTVSYVVDQARWWPSYTINLDRENETVQLELEALVAQRSGEDWTGINLALSTAELNLDARLPELPSQRLGRAQSPPPPSGYRPPPPGLEELFSGYDAARARLGQQAAKPALISRSARRRSAPRPAAPPAPASVDYGAGAQPPGAPRAEMDAEFSAAPAPQDFGSGAEMAKSMSMVPGSAPMRKKRAGAAPPSAGGPPPPAAPTEVEPGEGWLNFDRLRLAAPGSSLRGKLYRLPDDQGDYAGSGLALGSDIPPGLIDPVASRGSFDYRYDGHGHFSIPADGRGHGVQLQSCSGRCTWNWRCIPRVETAVYREVHFENPLDGALLDGPARVFIDGEFRSRAQLSRVDRGGEIFLGLGIEERIEVIRNARFEEEGAGLLGGKRCLDHEVEIRFRSSLSFPVTLEVIERVPVTDDQNVKVEFLSEQPKSTEYDQSDRGPALRGGRRWRLSIEAGATEELRYAYQVQIRTKDELIGGNRRE